jgi:hypothetical protein
MRYPQMLKPLFYIALFNALWINAFSQDTLPKVSVKHKQAKVIVSWVNPFPDVVLINIQRSADSLKNFKTILSVADPGGLTNGFLDSKAPDLKQFYRLYVQREGGKYFFTDPIKPTPDTARPKPKNTPAATKTTTPRTATLPPADPIPTEPTQPQNGSGGDESDPRNANFKPEKNSSQKVKFSNTKSPGADTSKVAQAPVREMKPPPVYIFVNSIGQVIVITPEDKKSLYTVKFVTESSGQPALTLAKIKDSHITLDKTNFHSSGWYKCEIYENEKYRSNLRVFIPKD